MHHFKKSLGLAAALLFLSILLQSCISNLPLYSPIVTIAEIDKKALQDRCDKAEVLYTDLTRKWDDQETMYFLETGEKCYVEMES